MNAEFIYSHFDLTITEKVTMEEPVYPTSNGENLPEWFLEEEQKYNDHVATLRSFHYELSEAEHGKVLREGIDFEIKKVLKEDHSPSIDISGGGYLVSVAVPIVPVVKDCNHEALIDTGVGYYHCPMCNEGWKYDEKPFLVPVVKQDESIKIYHVNCPSCKYKFDIIRREEGTEATH